MTHNCVYFKVGNSFQKKCFLEPLKNIIEIQLVSLNVFQTYQDMRHSVCHPIY